MNADLQQALAECGDTVTLNGHTVPAIVPDISEETANALFGEDFAIESVDIILPPASLCALHTQSLLRASLSIHGTPFVILSVIRHPDGAATITARKRQTAR
ncbi:MAG: hypothetical protein ACI4W7_00140 [Candidatus Spyradenecus sp.]